MSNASSDAATPLEWIAAALGAALTLATIGFLVYQGVADDDGVAELVAEVDSVIAQPNGWLVAIEVHNRGAATAAAVQVIGELRDSAGIVEASEMTLDYVPEASSRGGALLFTLNPAEYEIAVRPTGYARP